MAAWLWTSAGVGTRPAQEFFMSSAFDDPVTVEHMDPVGVADRAEPVSDNESLS
jgi:hypothetical protein